MRKWIAILLAVLLALSFACLAEDSPEVPQDTPDTTAVPLPEATEPAETEAPEATEPTETAAPENPEPAETEAPTATTPADTATPRPTATATPRPTATATPRPTATATPQPTATPTIEPSATPEPTAVPSASPTPEASVRPAATPAPIPENPALLMADPQQGTTMAVGGLFAPASSVLGSGISRDSITDLRFESTLTGAPAEAWDVSAAGDGRVLAWVRDGALTIAGDGGVWANEDSSGLFAGYSSLERVDFNGSFHVELAANLSHMFEGDWSLKSLDAYELVSPAATDMSYMFSSCLELAELDISSLRTGAVTNMEGMFLLDSKLESLDLSGFDGSAAMNLSSMFEGCAALQTLDLSGFRIAEAESLRRMFAGCASLEALRIGAGFPVEADAQDMFADCPAKLSVGGIDMNAEDWSHMGEYVGLQRRSKGDGVRWLQTRLLDAGYDSGKVDGVFGPITEAALTAWQTDHGFEPSGVTDADQVLALMR